MKHIKDAEARGPKPKPAVKPAEPPKENREEKEK